MYALAKHPEAQKKLRAELQQISTDTPTLDMLNSLPYLDHVVRESLRVYSAVFSLREAMEDDIIPLGTPIRDRNGNIVDHVKYACMPLLLTLALTCA